MPTVSLACSGLLSSSKADSDRGVIGLAISLPLYLVDALDLVEDDCFDDGSYGLEILVLDNKHMDMFKQQQQVLMERQRSCDMRLYPSHVVA
ncbi:hypothetical protein Tco_0908474 [Tanacetum coccineum]|uniref:Uncharacterized protein n=1 Tax=Tanacetum coccineum TaxID=301880 RepID=A0ABQ5CTN3_9ASTR